MNNKFLGYKTAKLEYSIGEFCSPVLCNLLLLSKMRTRVLCLFWLMNLLKDRWVDFC